MNESAGRPIDFDQVDRLRMAAQPELGSQFALTEIAIAAADFANLKLVGMGGVGQERDERADAVAIGSGALGLYAEPMPAVFAVVAVDDRRGQRS